jgi:hypothetical protein
MRRALAAVIVLALAAPVPALAAPEDVIPLVPQPKKVTPKRRAKPARPPPPAPTGPAELTLRLPSGLRGAQLFLDDRELGPVPVSPLPLPPGPYKVTVRRVGFADFTKRIELEPGKPYELVANLEAVSGVLSVETDHAGAEVFVDGAPVGKTPIEELLLTPGVHKVAVRLEGYSEEQVDLAVRAGKDYRLSPHLRPRKFSEPLVTAPPTELQPDTPPSSAMPLTAAAPAQTVSESAPLYKRWYVWVGAAAVVAAGAVVVYSVTSSGNNSLLQQACPKNDPCEMVLPGNAAMPAVRF